MDLCSDSTSACSIKVVSNHVTEKNISDALEIFAKTAAISCSQEKPTAPTFVIVGDNVRTLTQEEFFKEYVIPQKTPKQDSNVLKMHTPDPAEENFHKLAAMFPNAVTETITGYTTGKDGKEKPIIERAIDADVLRQEISAAVVEGPQERYQFTWPDKKKSVVLANAPIAKTLRLDRSRSVGRDGTRGNIDTENIYIEGDNLDALKLLQETYLGKVKMIYIDPPYNTGSDFIYEDDFSQATGEYLADSGQFDEEGNRLVQNTESNGRFHTDWLNMLYPRLRIAKDFLSEDGVIFISIDDNELDNLIKICNETFGEANQVATFQWKKRTAKSDVPFGVSQDCEWIVCYARSDSFKARIKGTERKYFETDDFPGKPWRVHDITTQRTAAERPNSNFTMVNPRNGEEFPGKPP